MFTGSFVSLGAFIGLALGSMGGTGRLVSWTERVFVQQSGPVASALLDGLTVLAYFAAPALAGALLASLTLSVAISGGFSFDGSRIAPDLDRINPAQGFSKLFSVKQLSEVGKAALMLALAAAFFVIILKSLGKSAFTAVEGDGHRPLAWLALAIEGWALKAAIGAVLLGVGDYWLARRRQLKDLMMTREEVRQEHKSSEGDPRHKAQRRAMHRQLAAGGPARGVQKATAIVVNPTHIAVAIRYEPKECEAPYLVAKGREEDAFAIRKEAAAHGIPIVKDIPLARSLIHYDVGEEIPEELYRAAAVVLKVAREARD